MNEQNFDIENWDEIRTAYQVARLGTLSAAAALLGVHHATVIRHIDALEARLGCKLFQRHARGYTPTEAGQDLLKVGAATEDQFAQLSGRLRGKGAAVSGELIVTTLRSIAIWVAPVLASFQRDHPDIRVTLILDERLLRLEYGEAHIALRAGEKPQEPDNVVQFLTQFSLAMFASNDYVARFGQLRGLKNAEEHRFIGSAIHNPKSPIDRWMAQNIPPHTVTFRTSDERGNFDAISAGAGIGFVELGTGLADPNLVQMMDPLPEWQVPVWLVCHVTLTRTAKIQAVTQYLKEQAKMIAQPRP